MTDIEKFNSEIKELGEKIAHAKQAVLISKSKELKSVRFKPEWVTIILLLVLFADMVRMMYRGNFRLSIAAIIGLVAIVVAYAIYLATIFVPNRREQKSADEMFEERNTILEALLTKRKALFEDFAKERGGRVVRAVSLERDIALWRADNYLYIAELTSEVKLEFRSIDTIRYISTDRQLSEYNRCIANYTITSHNATQSKNQNKIYYSYVFFDGGGNLILTDDAYPFLQSLMPEKELAAILNNRAKERGANEDCIDE